MLDEAEDDRMSRLSQYYVKCEPFRHVSFNSAKLSQQLFEWRQRQVPSHLHYPQAQAHRWQNVAIRQRCRQMLPSEVVLGTVQHSELCLEQ